MGEQVSIGNRVCDLSLYHFRSGAIVLEVCVCVVPKLLIMHIQTMHPKTHRATYILARGVMDAENPVGPWAVSRFSPSLHSKVQVYDSFFAGGGQTILTPSSPNRSLGAYLLWRSQ